MEFQFADAAPRAWLVIAAVSGLASPAATAGAAPASPTPVAASASAAPDRLGRPRPRLYSETQMQSRLGRPYRIRVSTPEGPPPPGGFPVLYVLDGDGWFGAAVEVVRAREYSRLRPTIVVGVGYPGADFFDAARRTYDFTPPGFADPGLEGLEQGGADQFLAFLTAELKPWAAARYRVNPRAQFLYGHSLGGLFVLHALFSAPGSFDAFIAASPSVGLAGGAILKGEARLLADPARKGVRVLITAGEFEGRPSPGQIGDYRRYFTEHPEAIPGQTPDAAVAELFPVDPPGTAKPGRAALAARLAEAGLDARYVEFAGEEHTSSAISALNRAVPFALRPPDQQ